ncbi:hypothetical protein D3C86_1145680 [compost metagenome]
MGGDNDIADRRLRHVTGIPVRIRLHPCPAAGPVENTDGFAKQQLGIDAGGKIGRRPQASNRQHDLGGRAADKTFGLHHALQFFIGEVGAEDIQAAVEHHGFHIQRLDLARLINNQIADFFQIKRTGHRAFYHNIAPVPLIPNPIDQPERAETVERAGNDRLGDPQHGGKTPDSVRRRHEINLQQDGGLTQGQIRLIVNDLRRGYTMPEPQGLRGRQLCRQAVTLPVVVLPFSFNRAKNSRTIPHKQNRRTAQIRKIARRGGVC